MERYPNAARAVRLWHDSDGYHAVLINHDDEPTGTVYNRKRESDIRTFGWMVACGASSNLGISIAVRDEIA